MFLAFLTREGFYILIFLHVDLYYIDQLDYSLSICMRDMN